MTKRRRATTASAKRKKGEEDGGCSVLFPLNIELFLLFGVGGDLLSHNLPVAVPSACAGLASGFGMGPGVSLQLLTTDKHTKQKYPFWVPFCSGCCVRYCIVDAVTTVTVSSFLLFVCSPVCWCLLWSISTSSLHTLQCFQVWPIYPIVFRGP